MYRNMVVAGHVPRTAAQVLEVGPGEGWLCSLLSRRGHHVVATDLARKWVSGVPPDRVTGRVAAAMTSLPFRGASFDAVIAAEVLEHIPELDAALSEAARVLKPGGRIVVTVPYRETLRPVTCPSCGVSFDPNGHVHTFDETRLSGALRRAGLSPGPVFIGPTRLSRELVRHAPIEPLLPLLRTMDRLTFRFQRVTDTWMLMVAVK
jgi:SAM-dependent methyltransferase